MELAIVKSQKELKKTIALTFVCICLLLCESRICAQDASRSQPDELPRVLPLPPRTDNSSPQMASRGKKAATSSNFVSTAVSLSLIVGVLIVLGRGMKWFGFQGVQPLHSDALELLGRRMIEPKVTIHLVRCGSRVLVLGVGPDGVRTLSEIDDPNEVERLTQACENTSKKEPRSPPRSNPDNKERHTKAATIAQRAFVFIATLGLLLAMASPTEAQSVKQTTSAVARTRESPPLAQPAPEPRAKVVRLAAFEKPLPFDIDPKQFGSPQQIGLSLKMLALMTVFSLAPSILMMTTCFVRFAVALGLLRQALGTQQGLPNQVLTAICMFLTFLVMSPVWQRCYEEGIRPYTNPAADQSPIDEATALARTLAPVRTFMEQQIDKANNSDAVWMLLDFQRQGKDSASDRSSAEPTSYDEVPLSVLAPAYLLSELKVGFLIGFQLFLPFLVIDLVVAMILTSLGLTMMPPAMVSLPFKLLLFVLIDGWFLTVGMLLESVRVA